MFEVYEIELRAETTARQVIKETLIDSYGSIREAIDAISAMGWEDESANLIRQGLFVRAGDGTLWATGIYITDPTSDEYPLLRWMSRSGLIETYKRVDAGDSYKAVKV